MDLRKLNIICYTVCIVCIIVGVVLTLLIIWIDVEREIAWKSFVTILVFFLASTLTLSVNKVIERRSSDRD